MEPVLELDELEMVRIHPCQCPRCGSLIADENSMWGAPRRESRRGFHEGKEYSLVESVQVVCINCDQIFTQNTYR